MFQSFCLNFIFFSYYFANQRICQNSKRQAHINFILVFGIKAGERERKKNDLKIKFVFRLFYFQVHYAVAVVVEMIQRKSSQQNQRTISIECFVITRVACEIYWNQRRKHFEVWKKILLTFFFEKDFYLPAETLISRYCLSF